jgi:Tfp pilus assembly protein PilZ
MFEDDRHSVEVPIELRVRKLESSEEIALELRCEKQSSLERLRLDVELSLWSESHFYSGLSGDASEVGLFVATYRPLRPGQSVLLGVELFGMRIEMEGIVRWGRAASEHAQPGVGIALLDVAPNARSLIDAFCAPRAPIYYEFENDEGQSG